MNYQNIHDTIILRAQGRLHSSVFEQHHILPKCEGGAIDGQLILLTTKEHRLVHLLRYKITGVLGNLLAYNLLKFGRAALSHNHTLFSAAGGREHHRQMKSKDPEKYRARQQKAGQAAGANSRDNHLGFFQLSAMERREARDKGRRTTVSQKLGMFDDVFRANHRLTLQKQIQTPQGIFNSMSAAAAAFDITPGAVTYRVQSSSEQWKEWYIMEKLQK